MRLNFQSCFLGIKPIIDNSRFIEQWSEDAAYGLNFIVRLKKNNNNNLKFLILGLDIYIEN